MLLGMRDVSRIIDIFGGLTATAKAIGVKYPSVVQQWRDRGNIPARYYPRIIAAAADRGVRLTLAEFFTDAAE